jgi:hypothetical protein
VRNVGVLRRHNYLYIAFLGSEIRSHLCSSYHLPIAGTAVARVSVHRKVTAVQEPNGSNKRGYGDSVHCDVCAVERLTFLNLANFKVAVSNTDRCDFEYQFVYRPLPAT